MTRPTVPPPPGPPSASRFVYAALAVLMVVALAGCITGAVVAR